MKELIDLKSWHVWIKSAYFYTTLQIFCYLKLIIYDDKIIIILFLQDFKFRLVLGNIICGIMESLFIIFFCDYWIVQSNMMFCRYICISVCTFFSQMIFLSAEIAKQCLFFEYLKDYNLIFAINDSLKYHFSFILVFM